MIKDKPRLIVFAGPNGSGKSTFTRKIYAACFGLPELYTNADEIAKSQTIGAYEAAQEAERRRRVAIEHRKSFVIETVMSTVEKIDLLRNAKAHGYEVHLIYVMTQSPKINLGRVYSRAKDGGHDVPPDKTVARYERSLKLLADAVKIADTARVIDNSGEFPLLIAEKV